MFLRCIRKGKRVKENDNIVLAASKVLDIEFSDLKVGYCLRYGSDHIFADIYMIVCLVELDIQVD